MTTAQPTSQAPPRLREPVRWKDRCALRSGMWLIGLIACLLFSRLLVETKATFTQCLLKRHTGIPCALCGSTRALAALSRGDFTKACAFNPVVSGGAMMAIGICGVGVVRPRVYRSFACFVRRRLRRKNGRMALLWFALLNWFYLLFAL